MSSKFEFFKEIEQMNNIYHTANDVYYTVSRYMRLFPENTEEDCERLGVEAALKKRNELLMKFMQEKIKNIIPETL